MDHLNITLEILAAAGGAEGKTISEQFGIDSYKLIAQVLTFVAVWFILKWKAFGPILEMLEKRKQRIAEGEENLKKISFNIVENSRFIEITFVKISCSFTT